MLAYPFSDKANQWIKGRKNWRQQINTQALAGKKKIWIHCASLGEFEQGRPLIEAIRKQYKDHGIVLTFFSPSGYEIRKDYDQADLVCYLPMDSKKNASDFIALIKPDIAIFVKYEFWYFYLSQLRRCGIPTLLVSAAFRPQQPFFKWHGGLFRKMLGCFTTLFVQDDMSAGLLRDIGFASNVVVAGDTRYDRVADIAGRVRALPVATEFKGTAQVLIAGSTWPADEKLLSGCMDELPPDWKMIIAPHEIHESHLVQITQLFADQVILYSEWMAGKKDPSRRVLVIDNIGMLSSLYAYGDLAYIGGGFAKGGIHNILEPAVYGLPVVFGPVYQKFIEANALVAAGYAFPVSDKETYSAILQKLITDTAYRAEISAGLKKFMSHHIGATQTILSHIASHQWLD